MAEVQLRAPRRRPPAVHQRPTTPARRSPPTAPPPSPAPAPRASSPNEVPLRFLPEVGTRAWLRVFWGEDCPNSYGRAGSVGTHNAEIHLADSTWLEDWGLGGDPKDYPEARWPTKCDHCGAAVPSSTLLLERGCHYGLRHILHKRLYRAPDGTIVPERDMQPGDCFHSTWLHEALEGCHYWDNCTGPHLTIICPDGHPWDVMSRASNCTKKDDRLHRCWVLHGDPSKGELVTVDKAGNTCSAGAGSIQTPGYHGMLTKSILRGC